MKRSIPILLTLALLLGSASAARAVPEVLRPGTRAMWATGAFGPAIELKWLTTQFKLAETFGYHFSGASDGPAIAIDLQEAFGGHLFTFQLVPRFVYDIQIIDGLGFYLSPSAGVGFLHISPDCQGWAYCAAWNGMTIQLAFEGKLVLGDRGLVFFRPFTLDISPVDAGPSWETTVRWDMLWGGGVIF